MHTKYRSDNLNGRNKLEKLAQVLR